jgi:hypothetical protein
LLVYHPNTPGPSLYLSVAPERTTAAPKNRLKPAPFSLQNPLGVSIAPPDGSASHSVKISSLVTRDANGVVVRRNADVFMDYAYVTATADDVVTLQEFLRDGGGIILAAQAWCGGAGRGMRGDCKLRAGLIS